MTNSTGKTRMLIEGIGSVTFVQSSRARYLRLSVRNDTSITVTIPRKGNFSEARRFVESKVSWIRKQLDKMEQRAKNVLPLEQNVDLETAQDQLFARLERFSRKYGLDYNRAAFRCQKTLWGSCSSQNNISLNINIAFLPCELQDYVLLHELVHTKIKNHSRQFWDELDRYTNGRARQLAKELKACRMHIRNDG